MNILSIILPVYNEKGTIERVLNEWMKELEKYNLQYRFVICEDGSTDGTKEFLKKIKNKYKLILNQKNERRGYGRAVIDGIKTSKSKYLLCIDSDGQCDPKDFKKFWKNKDKAGVIIGWRKKRTDAFQRKIFSQLFKLAHSLLFPSNIHDPSAPFVLFKKETIFPHLDYLKYLNEGFWWGFVGMCVKNNLLVFELPINHRSRLDGKTQVYITKKIPSIALRNLLGLLRLKFVK
ncbi:MAG: glycosyltransferase family 2 protein [Candidatus Levybacteria bacterium]|nr:glycosyltransferase family 2 protein [Candidatus Levybacteria bacterium]